MDGCTNAMWKSKSLNLQTGIFSRIRIGSPADKSWHFKGNLTEVLCELQLVAWHSGRTSVSDWRTFPVLRSTCSWWVTTNVSKPSDVCCRLQVAPSGESYGGNRRPAESNGSLLPGLWRDSLHVTCGLTACTPGSAPGPTLGNEYGKTLPFIMRTE